MSLIAFMQAQNCSNYVGSWRHPSSMSDFLTPHYFQRIARTLEDAKFDMAFFDDRLAMPDIYGNDHRETVANGVRCVKLDPSTVLMTMAAVTRRLGLGATYSTTYYQPFHVARLFGTLDLMTGGRVAWNIVTSLNDSEAENFGYEEHLAHDLRYDRADEFLEVVKGHWDSWEDDALIVDKSDGRFADPDKVHRLDHKGRYFRSKGPLPVPRSPQGHPVLLQAGQSGRGTAFAARWAELVFASYANLEAGRKQYASLTAAIEKAGRDPAQVKIAPAIKVIVGETAAQAQEQLALTEALAKPIDALALLCEVLNVDFSTRPYDEPFTDEELAAVSWHSLRDKVIEVSGKKNPSVRDFVEASGRGTIHEGPTFAGTAKQVADQMEEWFGTACDGFVISATCVPGSYEDFARLVVPELQRRGLYRKEYPGSTLRETLGIARPTVDARRATAERRRA
ncbi:LLM class flavin-dependent oxidoreductase [Bradyrhizobium sp. WSM 1704]|uniref:LLM class flavin-dependent oxidoreductase n=1 Tax=Bradyrhizobium semiaridum TaxID=2821404 RepID=UPI001CE24250|nr:LLM class flavin-dependent oxidoreductase [Bradyrhizobium semiaridum]MCA6123168.1 LLM class flavin-dependent oxidoreductase [Bradyrhizobium semiaridum]